jgi:hypothetical protein
MILTDDTAKRVLMLLQSSILEARGLCRDNPRLFVLLDAVHNVPDLILRPEMWTAEAAAVLAQLREYDSTYGTAHSRLLEEGTK